MTRIVILGGGEYFGELALLRDVARTATVRAVEPTDVIAIGRGDFEAFSRNLSLLRTTVEATVEESLEGAKAP